MTKTKIKSALIKKGRWNLENAFLLNLTWEFFKGETITYDEVLDVFELSIDDVKAVSVDAAKKEADEILKAAKEEAEAVKKEAEEEKKELQKIRKKAMKAMYEDEK